MPRYIVISEFGDVHKHMGCIPDSVLSAADDGLYDLINITDPENPTHYRGGYKAEWVPLNDLPSCPED